MQQNEKFSQILFSYIALQSDLLSLNMVAQSALTSDTITM